jgi:ADP-heptose:LPS heptosyltransferase
MGLLDWTGKILNTSKQETIPPPKRLLLCNIAHFGDVVNALGLVAILKRSLPEVEIGFLAGSWSRPLLELFPDIQWIHSFDHRLLNRQSSGTGSKLLIHARSAEQARREIRAVGYDIAVETYYYARNSIPLLWRSRIPARIGYTSGGFGALLTHSLDWNYESKHILAYHLDLLQFLNVHPPLPPQLPWPSMKPSASKAPVAPRKDYVVVHPGSGADVKSWPLATWRTLVKALSDRGHFIVFTGRGASERANIEAISMNIANCLNLCDLLNWEQFIEILRNAQLLIGIDSLGGHLAAVVDTPSALIYTGRTNRVQFSPLSQRSALMTYPVPCAPCFLPEGCGGMECVRLLTAETVLERALSVLEGIPPSQPEATATATNEQYKMVSTQDRQQVN